MTAPLVATLARLYELLGGELAVISGRPIAQIDALLYPLVLPAAGVHGLERRDGAGRFMQAPIPDMSSVLAAAQMLAASQPAFGSNRNTAPWPCITARRRSWGPCATRSCSKPCSTARARCCLREKW